MASNNIHRMTLWCKNKDCSIRVRVGRFVYDPVLKTGPFVYCPVCGGAADTNTDVEESYWEVLAESYELPVEALKQIYSIWNPDETPKFSEFVETLKKEAGLV